MNSRWRGLVMVLCFCGILFGVMNVLRSLRPPAGAPLAEDKVWFWDLVEQRRFSASVDANPPVESPWGNPSPFVVFFSCGDCNESFPGFYISFSPEVKARLDADPESAGSALGPSHPDRLYSIDGTNWLAVASIEQAPEISTALAERCPGSLRVCR